MNMWIYASIFVYGCAEQKEEDFASVPSVGSTDADQDGLIVSEDCDDQNPDDVAWAGDCDQDGVGTQDDCDDGNAQSTIRAEDSDCDGVLTEEDCDDENPELRLEELDQDCDGSTTEEDCDDEDDDVGAVALDQDCDGVMTQDDCDDGNAQSTIRAEDSDCDGVLAEEDCDDDNVEASSRVDDSDCDGVLEGQDCHDQNPLLGNVSQDMDCDGITSEYDCDDTNPNITLCQNILSLGGGYTLTSVRIPGGSFMMGSPPHEVGRQNDETEHFVTLTQDYDVSTTEITQGMFFFLMGYSSSVGYPSNGGLGDEYPAYYVSWHMAAAFSNQLTARHNEEYDDDLLLCYNCAGSEALVTCSEVYNPYECSGYRLLTEAEWEYAARSGSEKAFWTSNGGGDLDATDADSCEDVFLSDETSLLDSAIYCGVDDTCTSQNVTSVQPNGFGLYSMNGNVMEWVHDPYATFNTTEIIDPLATPNSTYVARGGHACSSPKEIRSAHRTQISASSFGSQFRGVHLGFRVGRSRP